ncbi:MAG: UDP-N-acetylmuramate dehydrogenase [Myxococcales bacterium]
MSLLADLQKALGGKVEQRSELSARTSMRVGGAADYLATPQDERALAQAIDVCVQHAVPYQVLGGGSNTIVSDQGVRGVVLRLAPKLVAEEISASGDKVAFKLSAGAPLSRLINAARARDCVGMEFLAGIPGTVGGAVAMNAGTPKGSTGQICRVVGVCEPGRARTVPAEEVGFAYRRTMLPAHAVITWARFELAVGDINDVQRSRLAVEDDLTKRRRTQPHGLPSAGSIFRNPPGDYAGRLLQACGMKGKRVGGAQVSEIHANFIVNRGEATAADVLRLMRQMQEAVLESSGVLLVPEVKLMGDFDPAELPRGLGLPREPTA